MVAKKKPAEKQTFLRPEHRLELLEANNKSKGVMDATTMMMMTMSLTSMDFLQAQDVQTQ